MMWAWLVLAFLLGIVWTLCAFKIIKMKEDRDFKTDTGLRGWSQTIMEFEADGITVVSNSRIEPNEATGRVKTFYPYERRRIDYEPFD